MYADIHKSFISRNAEHKEISSVLPEKIVVEISRKLYMENFKLF